MSQRILPTESLVPWFLDCSFRDVWNNVIWPRLETECCKCGNLERYHLGECYTKPHLVNTIDILRTVFHFSSPDSLDWAEHRTIITFAIEKISRCRPDEEGFNDCHWLDKFVKISLARGIHASSSSSSSSSSSYLSEFDGAEFFLKRNGPCDGTEIIYKEHHGIFGNTVATRSLVSFNLYWGRTIDREQLFKMKYHM